MFRHLNILCDADIFGNNKGRALILVQATDNMCGVALDNLNNDSFLLALEAATVFPHKNDIAIENLLHLTSMKKQIVSTLFRN